ncbi:MAG: hypothetical protein M1825_003907 [Sarcosagium campestre]|nr:MAG: hypothetical protein M1825_003907 [Sarcosagium campestre]
MLFTTPEDPDRTTTPTASDKDGDIAMSTEQADVASAPANETSRDEAGKEDITDVSAGEALGDTIAAAKETNGVQPWHPALSELMDSLSATAANVRDASPACKTHNTFSQDRQPSLSSES